MKTDRFKMRCEGNEYSVFGISSLRPMRAYEKGVINVWPHYETLRRAVHVGFLPIAGSAVAASRCGVVLVVRVCRWARVVDGGVTATGVLSRERGNLITICITLY